MAQDLRRFFEELPGTVVALGSIDAQAYGNFFGVRHLVGALVLPTQVKLGRSRTFSKPWNFESSTVSVSIYEIAHFVQLAKTGVSSAVRIAARSNLFLSPYIHECAKVCVKDIDLAKAQMQLLAKMAVSQSLAQSHLNFGRLRQSKLDPRSPQRDWAYVLVEYAALRHLVETGRPLGSMEDVLLCSRAFRELEQGLVPKGQSFLTTLWGDDTPDVLEQKAVKVLPKLPASDAAFEKLLISLQSDFGGNPGLRALV